MKTIEAVKCSVCGAIHDTEAETFVRVEGNIYIGVSGGIVGNNIEYGDYNSPATIESTIFCNSCFVDFIQENLNRVRN